MMGEQGQLHKGEGGLRTQLTHVPWLIYYPQGAWAGRKFDGLVQHPDCMPTLLDILGVGMPGRITGESMKPAIDADRSSNRDWIYGGWHNHGFMRSKEWLYIGRWNPGDGVEEIYDLQKNSLELKSVSLERQEMVPEFRKALKDFVDSSWSTTQGTIHHHPVRRSGLAERCMKAPESRSLTVAAG